MPIKKIVLLIGLLMLVTSCSYWDDNYDKNEHAANVERCRQSLADGSAYEIDETLTAAAPWEVGDVVAKFKDAEGGYILREFLGVSKAGYYLVQDYSISLDGIYPRYNVKKITNQTRITEPFALMSLRAVKSKETNSIFSSSGIPSACGAFKVNYWGRIEQGVFLDGVKYGERYDNAYSKSDDPQKRNLASQ